jgi:lipopolysaccharide/colanic/teichoic acid biosynthesis glycosyltransferase
MNFLQNQIRNQYEWWDFLIEAVKTEKSTENKFGQYYKMKRKVDIIISIFLMVFIMPLFLLIIIMIKLTSRGPAIFKQYRVGKGGKLFEFYKFRTMKVVDNNDDDIIRKINMINFIKTQGLEGTNNKVINNDRVTKVGRFLRKTSLDELPQLINVLKGNMSLVGPRPCVIYEFENYEPWHKKRLAVLPGCTGYWQVWGRGKVSFTESVIMDIFYSNNITFWGDIKIILGTIPVMLFGIGGK